MFVIGLVRPGFHGVVSHAFGAEVNGHAAASIAVLFLAALPATAALPTVMVRHVSRALGSGDRRLAIAHASLATRTAALLTLLSAAGAVAYGIRGEMAPADIVFVVIGLAAYNYWRLVRTLLLAVGDAAPSLAAELVATAAMGAGLGALVIADRPEWAVGAFTLVFVAYVPLTLHRIRPLVGGGAVDAAGMKEFVRYNLYWFASSGVSLGVRELSVLLLDRRVEKALVGDMAVALSVLMLLAFAPRVIELPLVHELSALGGRNDALEQRRLASSALHWLTVLTFAMGCGTAIAAEPLLFFAGEVRSAVVVHAFAIVALAFMLEMIVTPAANLMIASSHPGVFTLTSAISLVAAVAWWYGPYGSGPMGVMAGLAVSHAARAVGIAAYAKVRLGLTLFEQPVRKVLAVAAGGAFLWWSLRGDLHPWVAFLGFELTMLILFFDTLRRIVGALSRRSSSA
jgi:O-antigen/teichoic acid export membrane protein